MDFCWCLPWASKPGRIPLLTCFIACMQQIPQIHPWCDTCWPLWPAWWLSYFPSTYLQTYKHWSESGIEYATASQCGTRRTLYWISYVGSATNPKSYRLAESTLKITNGLLMQAQIQEAWATLDPRFLRPQNWVLFPFSFFDVSLCSKYYFFSINSLSVWSWFHIF